MDNKQTNDANDARRTGMPAPTMFGGWDLSRQDAQYGQSTQFAGGQYGPQFGSQMPYRPPPTPASLAGYPSFSQPIPTLLGHGPGIIAGGMHSMQVMGKDGQTLDRARSEGFQYGQAQGQLPGRWNTEMGAGSRGGAGSGSLREDPVDTVSHKAGTMQRTGVVNLDMSPEPKDSRAQGAQAATQKASGKGRNNTSTAGSSGRDPRAGAARGDSARAGTPSSGGDSGYMSDSAEPVPAANASARQREGKNVKKEAAYNDRVRRLQTSSPHTPVVSEDPSVGMMTLSSSAMGAPLPSAATHAYGQAVQAFDSYGARQGNGAASAFDSYMVGSPLGHMLGSGGGLSLPPMRPPRTNPDVNTPYVMSSTGQEVYFLATTINADRAPVTCSMGMGLGMGSLTSFGGSPHLGPSLSRPGSLGVHGGSGPGLMMGGLSLGSMAGLARALEEAGAGGQGQGEMGQFLDFARLAQGALARGDGSNSSQMSTGSMQGY